MTDRDVNAKTVGHSWNKRVGPIACRDEMLLAKRRGKLHKFGSLIHFCFSLSPLFFPRLCFAARALVGNLQQSVAVRGHAGRVALKVIKAQNTRHASRPGEPWLSDSLRSCTQLQGVGPQHKSLKKVIIQVLLKRKSSRSIYKHLSTTVHILWGSTGEQNGLETYTFCLVYVRINRLQVCSKLFYPIELILSLLSLQIVHQLF